MNVVSFSFGQTSGRLLRLLMDEHGAKFDKLFKVIFCNTGKENNATLDFGNEVSRRWGVEIIWLEYHRVPAVVVPIDVFPEGRRRSNHAKKQEAREDCHWFKEVNYETARRTDEKNTPFDELLEWMVTLPNVRTRACSSELKTRTLRRYLWSIGVGQVNDYIGIRNDEAHRAVEILARADELQRVPFFPLIDAKITKRDVADFWNAQPFKLNIPNYLGNCDLCFLKAKWKRLAILREWPQVGEWWRQWETRKREKVQGGVWVLGESIEGLMNDAAHPELNFNPNEQDVACSCAVGGSKEWDENES